MIPSNVYLRVTQKTEFKSLFNSVLDFLIIWFQFSTYGSVHIGSHPVLTQWQFSMKMLLLSPYSLLITTSQTYSSTLMFNELWFFANIFRLSLSLSLLSLSLSVCLSVCLSLSLPLLVYIRITRLGQREFIIYEKIFCC